MDKQLSMHPADELLCRRDRAQLVVIDIQTKLGDIMPGKVLNRIVQNTALLLKAASLLNIPVLATEHYPQGLGPIQPAVLEHLPATTTRIEKTSFSGTGAERFMEAVAASNRRQLILIGMEAHICVLQTALDLLSKGYRVLVVEDAICSRKLENYQNALVRLQQSGALVVSAESIVFEWLEDAKHEHFKAIAALIK
jgi:nicotinamidase-related amidase